mgnify:CR=1 FL=1
MSRQYCIRCNRPPVACICKFCEPIENKTLVVVLQHPTEVKQTKGTLPLLAGSLSNIEILIGENFSENERLNSLLSEENSNCVLVYPSEDAIEIKNIAQFSNKEEKKNVLILIDGTWKKAYKMFQLSKNLHSVTHLKLGEDLVSRYQIRKTKKKNALSTLEACSLALSQLEHNQEDYNCLLNKFEQFNDFQLSFVKNKS